MSDATLNPLGPGKLPANIELAAPTVQAGGLVPELLYFLQRLGTVHLILFDLPVFITSANDGTHAPDSKHFLNRAVDLRSRDKTIDEADLYLVIIAQLCRQYKLNVFDERQLVSGPHFHVETAD